MREVEVGQGFVCKDEAEKIEIFTKLEKLGYEISKNIFYNGNLAVHTNSAVLGIFFNGKYFCGSMATHIKEVLNKEEFFSEVLIASQEWKPYSTPKRLLLGDKIHGTFDYYVEVLGEYEGYFIDEDLSTWRFAKEVHTPKYTHEQLVEIVGHEFIQL